MTQERPIRVMIVDDHAVLRAGLRLFLMSFAELELVGEAENGQEGLRLCGEVHPDVILMDMVMPAMDGADTTRLILKQYPAVKIIILTSFHEQEQVEKAIRAGAVGYLFKNVEAQELANAIRRAHAGQSTLAPEAVQALMQATRTRAGVADYGLTEREKEVLALLVEGLSNLQIAERLTITRATAKFHVGCILVKLHVSTRTEAVSLALQQGLVS